MPRARSRAPLPSSARVRKLCHFLDNPQNDPMISLSFYRKLTLFLPSFTPAKQQILQGRVVLQDRRFCPDCLVRFQRVFFILFYPFVRSFVVVRIKVFQTSSGKKKRIKIILSALSPFFFERLSKSNAFSQHENNQNQSLTNSFFAFVFSRLRRFSLKQQKKRRPTKIPQIRRHRRVVADGNLPNRRRRRGNRGRRHHFVRLHPHRFGARFRVIES